MQPAVIIGGVSVGAVGCGTAIQAGRSRARFPMGRLQFFIDVILPAALCPWGRLSLKGSECQEYFLVVKGGRCVIQSEKSPYTPNKMINRPEHARFKALTAVLTKIQVFWKWTCRQLPTFRRVCSSNFRILGLLEF